MNLVAKLVNNLLAFFLQLVLVSGCQQHIIIQAREQGLVENNLESAPNKTHNTRDYVYEDC
jgi:sensor domain CHASE-containing protein